MRMYILILLMLVGCGGGSTDSTNIVVDVAVPPIVIDKPNQLSITRFDLQTSWYELKQYFDGVPKYSGAFGTYPQQTNPVAVKCSLGEWATTSNNRDGNLTIYSVNLSTGDYYTVHTELGITDPHMNAAIQCGGGKLWIAVSARGYKVEGYLYTSTNGIDWDKSSNGFKSYPQLHWINNKLITLYTNYLSDPSQPNNVSRTLFSSCNNKKIVNDNIAHYSLSYYDKNTSRLSVIYTDLPNGADSRTNLHYTYSDNGGCDWSVPETWHTGDLVYLKDFNMVNGELTTLVTLSNSYDPTKGDRGLYTVTQTSKTFIDNINHNYTTGALSSSGAVIIPQGNTQYAGGKYLDSQYINYIKRVHGTEGSYVASEGISAEYQSDAWLVLIK